MILEWQSCGILFGPAELGEQWWNVSPLILPICIDRRRTNIEMDNRLLMFPPSKFLDLPPSLIIRTLGEIGLTRKIKFLSIIGLMERVARLNFLDEQWMYTTYLLTYKVKLQAQQSRQLQEINPEYIFWKSTLKKCVSWVQNKGVKQKKVRIP